MNQKESLLELLYRAKGTMTIGELADVLIEWKDNCLEANSFSKSIKQNAEELNLQDPHFHGSDYDKSIDQKRLTMDLFKVFDFMMDGAFHTLKEISDSINVPEASVSAHLRSLRKEIWGSHIVEKQRHRVRSGLFEYRVLPNTTSFTYQQYVLSKSSSYNSCGEI